MKKFFFLWGPPIVWMAIIFFLSSRTRIAVSDVYTINFFIFKSLHVIEYAILCFLCYRAFSGGQLLKHNPKALRYAFIVSVLYAVSDELHQTFVPTREGHLRDILIDTVGVTIMYIYLKKISK